MQVRYPPYCPVSNSQFCIDTVVAAESQVQIRIFQKREEVQWMLYCREISFRWRQN